MPGPFDMSDGDDKARAANAALADEVKADIEKDGVAETENQVIVDTSFQPPDEDDEQLSRSDKRRGRVDDLIHDSRRAADAAERRAEAAEARADQAEKWARERRVQEERTNQRDPLADEIAEVDAERERLYASKPETPEDSQKVLARAKELEEKKISLSARREYMRMKAQEPSAEMQGLKARYAHVVRHPNGADAVQANYFRRTMGGEPKNPATMEAAFEDASKWIQSKGKAPAVTDAERSLHSPPPVTRSRGSSATPSLKALNDVEKAMAMKFYEKDEKLKDNPKGAYLAYAKMLQED